MTIFKFSENPARCGILSHFNSLRQIISFGDTSRKIWNLNGITFTIFKWRKYCFIY